MVLVALALSQPMIAMAPPGEFPPPGDPEVAFRLFHEICYAPFPDPATFARVRAKNHRFSRWQPAPPFDPIRSGERWLSPSATIVYFPSGAHADGQQAPECVITAAIPAETVVEPLFARFAAANGLGRWKVVSRASAWTAMWDLDKGNDARWRIIFGTQRHVDKTVVKLSILNLSNAR